MKKNIEIIMRKINKLLQYIFYILFLPIWCLERLIPRNKKIWVFGAWYGQKYSDNSKYIYEFILQNYKEIKPFWITKNREIYSELKSKQFPVFMANSWEGIKICLCCYYTFISSTAEDINEYCLNGSIKIWLWHGMPLKKILYGEDKYIKLSNIRKLLIKYFNPYHYIKPDYVLSSSSFFDSFLSISFNIPVKKILTFGLPRCDLFFGNNPDHYIESLKIKYPNCKIILYMPTFRMSAFGETPFNPFQERFSFDLKEFYLTLYNENYIFLYKPHYCDSKIDDVEENDHFIKLTDNMFEDLYSMINNIDILATDYSSIYFDFLVTGKPIILLPFDYDTYIKNSRSHYFNYFKEMSAYKCYSWSDFMKCLIERNYYQVEQGEVKKFAEYLDGNSSKKIIEHFFIQK
jgi:CDP-glycerol glycerophosphotransferase